jgi:hypothetical protein
MRKLPWKGLGSAVGLVLLVLGLVDIPEQIEGWAGWLEPLQGDAGRWLIALAGLLIIIAANHEALWAWVKRRKPAGVDSAPSPIERTHQPQAMGGQPEQPAEPVDAPEQVAEPPEPPREGRRRDGLAFREAFDTFINTFLERRRQVGPQRTHDEFGTFRDEYRVLQRRVVAAYRPVKDLYLNFLHHEPQFDRRNEVYGDEAHYFSPDNPLTDLWSALTFDEALHRWENADDEHFAAFLERDRAVLDAFADWAAEEHQDDPLAHLPHHYREVVRMRRAGYREVTIADELGLSRRTVATILSKHYRD